MLPIYTCPMHPEVTSDKPGRCPKCGMALVLAGSTSSAPDKKELGPITWKSYLPLIVIIFLILTVTTIFFLLLGSYFFKKIQI